MAAKSKTQARAVPQPSEDDELIISRGELHDIRDALLIGLASYGEIERLCDAAFPPGQLDVIHPTGSADTVGDFAEALRHVARAERRPDAEATHG